MLKRNGTESVTKASTSHTTYPTDNLDRILARKIQRVGHEDRPFCYSFNGQAVPIMGN